MILKFTSLNSNLRMNASPPIRTSQRYRWLAGLPLLLLFLLFNVNQVEAQCPGAVISTCASDALSDSEDAVQVSADLHHGCAVVITSSSYITGPADDCTGGAISVLVTYDAVGCPTDPGAGLSCMVTVSIPPDTDAPTIVEAAGALDAAFTCAADVVVPAAPTAMDDCNDATVTINTVSDLTSPGACANSFTRVITYNAEDGCGNISPDYTVTITVADNVAPTITEAPGALDATFICAADIMITAPTATDNCMGNTVTINTVSDVTTPGACANKYTRVITYNADDGCGNTSPDYTVTLTVDDNDAPSFDQAAGALDAMFTCDADVIVPTAPTATDNCMGNTVTINMVSDVTTPGACANKYTRVITYNADDGCGNTSPDYTVTLTVNDDVPPTGTAPMPVTGQCMSDVPAADITAVTDEADNCGSVTVTVADTDNGATGCNGAPFIVTRTYTLDDGCGNTTDLVQTITIEDDTAPTGTAPTAVTGQCMSDVPAADITAVTDEADNCGSVTVTVADTDNGATGCDGDPFIVTRTYTLDDGCGNTTDLVQTITIENTTPLALSPQVNIVEPADASNCDNTVSWPTPTSTDPCGGATTITVATLDPKNDASTIVINSGGGIDFADFPVGQSTVTYTATDACNNTAELSFTVTIEDNEDPMILGCPPSQTFDFASCVGGATLTPNFVNQGLYTDNCPNNISVFQWPNSADYPTLEDIPGHSTIADGDTIHVTLTLDDGSGNTDVCTFIVTLASGDAPVPDISGPVLEPDSSECGTLIIVAPTATDACGEPVCGTPFPVDPAIWSQVPGTGPCPGSTAFDTFDGAGNPQPIPVTGTGGFPCVGGPTTSVATSTLTGTVGTAPGEYKIENVKLNLDHSWNSDLDISLVSPTGTTIDLSSDNGGGFGSIGYLDTEFQDGAAVSIEAGINPMTGVFAPEEPLATFNGETVTGDWTLSICDDTGGDSGTLNSWSITFSSTPAGSIPQYEFEPGNHTITWIYDDGAGNSSTQLQQLVVTEDTEVPSIVCDPITVILDENGEGSIEDFGNSTTTSLSLGDEQSSSLIPMGFTFPFYNTSFSDLTINSNGLLFFPNTNFHVDFARADLDPGVGGTINYYTTGTSPNQMFVLNFNDVPHWNDPATVTTQVVLHESGLIEIFGTEYQAGNPMTQGLGSTGINFLNVIVAGRLNSVFSATNDAVAFIPDGFGGYTIDQSGAFAPVATPFAVEDFITFDDNCGVDMTSISADITDFDCDDVGTVFIEVSILDLAGNPNSCFSAVTVLDNTAPVLFNVPGTATAAFDCSEIPDTTGYNVFATDNCDDADITYTFNTLTTQVGDASSCDFYDYTMTRIWTATDASGNATTASELIFIEDNNTPDFSASLPTTINATADLLSCDASVTVNISSLDYSDSCAMNSVLTLTNNITAIGNDASGTYPIGTTTVIFEAEDPCGNIGTYTVDVVVSDGTAPVALCSPTTISIPSGSDTVAILPLYINNGSIDNCLGVLNPNNPAQMWVTPTSFDCTQLGDQTVVLTVSDGTLQGSCSTTVTVQDLTPPDAVCAAPFDINVDASGTAMISVSDIDAGSSDACSDLFSTEIDITSFGFADINTTTDVTLTVTDNSMNVSTCITQVTVLGPTTCFDVGAAVGGAGNVIEIPVSVTDFTSVNSFQFTLAITGDDTVIDLGEFEEILTNVHPDLDTPGSILFPSISYDSLPTNDTLVHVEYGDILNGMGDPYDGVLDTIDVAAVLDTLLFANTLSISYLGDASLPGVTLADDEVVFNLNVLLTGNIGQSTSILNILNINNTPPEILYDFGGGNLLVSTPCFEPGGFLINELIVSGAIYTEPATNCDAPAPDVPASTAVGLVDVELYEIIPTPPFETLEDTYTTGNDGLFEFTINGAGDYELRPEKDINWGNQLGTITSFDVQRIQAHAVGATPLCTAYKKIAADVNDNGQVTTVDAALLNFFVVNNVPPLPTPNDPPNKSWRFVDAKQVLPNIFDATVPAFDEVIVFDNLISDTTDNDFIGVKIGDIDNNIDPLQITTGGNDEQVLTELGQHRNGNLEFVIKDATTVADEALAVDFTAKSFDNMVAYQWILKFDEKALAFEGLTPQALVNLGDNNVGIKALDYGLISFTWYNVEAVSHSEEDVLFTLNFTGLKDGVKLSDMFEVQEFNVFPTEAYTNNAEIRDIELSYSNDKVAGAFELFQNQPNPFKDETNISFNLPTASAATLTISDATGRTLRVIEGDYDKGYNEISIDRNTLSASGVLYYQLETSEYSATKKMIVITK